jgi:hypothetical protein
MVTINEATNGHLEELSILFDLYRQFYRQPSDTRAAKKFLSDRLEKKNQ